VRLVVDWDATCTVADTLQLALVEFGDRDVFERCEEQIVRGEISYRDLMETEMGTITASVDEVAGWLVENVEMRHGFHELAERHRPLVLSSGFEELIRPLLAREGVELEVAANRLDPRPDGWRVRWRDGAQCTECGDSCKRGSLPESDGELVYVGDGYSDRCAALAADRVFARDALAAYLDERGVAYRPFEDLYEVAAAL
jgi:2-hydroxy-3-keto-5-methylthiopentenyl-1-phosphate phosphatase